MFYLDVAYVFCNGFNCFSCVFASFSDACFKYFIWLQTYVASVACKCFKSRSSVASPSSSSVASLRCLLLPAPAGHPNQRRKQAPPLPLFSMLVTSGTARAPHGVRETECVYVDISIIQSYCERVPKVASTCSFFFSYMIKSKLARDVARGITRCECRGATRYTSAKVASQFSIQIQIILKSNKACI